MIYQWKSIVNPVEISMKCLFKTIGNSVEIQEEFNLILNWKLEIGNWILNWKF